MKLQDLTIKSVAYAAVVVAVLYGVSSLRTDLRERRMRVTANRAAPLVTALDHYRDRTGHYPVSDEAPIERIMPTLEGEDGWGRPFRYLSSGDSYVLWSLGENGQIDRIPGGGEYEDRNSDFIIASGVIWQAPAGFY